MTVTFPSNPEEKREYLLDAVERIGPTLRESGAKSEELGKLAPEAVNAIREAGLFRLKLTAEMGGAEADPITEMMVLERLAYHDLTSGWCTMVGATGIASLGTFLPEAGLARVFKDGNIPTASISFFPAGRATRVDGGFRVNGRWRFNSGISHSEWVIGGTIVETPGGGDGPPEVIFTAFPFEDITLYDNWRDVVGLKGTGSCDCSVEEYFLPEELTFAWDLMEPKPLRGGPSYLIPPFSYVAKEHGSVAIGAGRRVLDELIHLATSTRGTFRASKLDERPVVHRIVAEADLKLRSARALMHERYAQLWEKVNAGTRPDGADVADVRAIGVMATDAAIDIASKAYHFAGNTALHQPHVIERIFRDIHTAGLHQVMSDTAYENHGRFRLGLPADPMS